MNNYQSNLQTSSLFQNFLPSISYDLPTRVSLKMYLGGYFHHFSPIYEEKKL
jgi:hypothetical protein